ncbi:enoyl-CoA hydratase/isomerase family protein [Ammoniphilus sp. CFH 90114]|uniref:enoyl-CoA hydratase/isomerase family protein n=1 Tax=Ammoniphilus sp. CFH 90114 TaxID=2493665 RepID=UPI00100EB0CE|nr:enoyl-CoA hydratase-related protein [Ammoniphilus sp. CFH 90114]RXT06585.1 enoyl-CoA hydratase/isomerase family protein [Ammoniphilus sp. CFH 90114]
MSDLLIDIQNFIATITINRPEVHNAMNAESWNELGQAMRQLNDNPDVRVIVITGAGEKAFVAGADLQWIRDRKPTDIYSGVAVQDVLREVYKSSKPTIAAVNGYALGGGCELMTACDIRIASERARFGQPEVKVGILPAGGGTQQLAKLIGLAKAKELIFTGDMIDAEEAYRIGLINYCVPHQELMGKVNELATKIANQPPIAVRMAKIALNESIRTDLDTGLALEKSLQAILFGTRDKYEGTNAFLEKREPTFLGE